MDITTLGVASVAAITILCYWVGLIVKATPLDDKYIPVVCGAAGALLGLLWFLSGFPDFPASDPITAAAVGIVSGLAATGVNQITKQLKGD
ncbi:conserved membrane hypothetical protein [uncultured Eubacteriales bacterium]|uniref:Enolase n=1 Tax=uncultured Eubacteriales bacterium TaxID=172733 RepID=A0A212J4U8_9FIRM|nr:conserved membrane hypothetical protein [uncultured Eubacteriales bacterium]